MPSEVRLKSNQGSAFKDKLMELIPEGGNLNLCLTCGLCSSGCPATGLVDMDPRKFVRMAMLGMDEDLKNHEWAWMCTMCQRCIHVCPMNINIPQLVYHVRKTRPREDRPVGILASCDLALRHDTCSAMGASEEDWRFVVEDVADEVRATQPGFEELRVPMDKMGSEFFLNQNSREPVTEPEEMIPLWKVLDGVGVDWTYASKGWAAENYCMFLADDDAWRSIVQTKVDAVEALGCKVWLNTE